MSYVYSTNVLVVYGLLYRVLKTRTWTQHIESRHKTRKITIFKTKYK